MDDLTVAENIAFREKQLKKSFGYVNKGKMNVSAKEKLKKTDLEIDAEIQTKFLRVSEKQLLLVVREVLSKGAKVVAFDEVANALS